VLRYLQEFARRFDLHGLVRLETEVVRVHRDDASAARWWVSYCSRRLADAENEEREVEEEEFDAIVVCNGHYTEPRLADFAGNACAVVVLFSKVRSPITCMVIDRVSRASILITVTDSTICRHRLLAREAAAQLQLPCTRPIPRPSALSIHHLSCFLIKDVLLLLKSIIW
jgi:hypothetical protein